MMPKFRFDDTDSFEANWEKFLVEMQSIDAEMASILRANKGKLAAIVCQGHRNTQARADFNAGVIIALDSLLRTEFLEKSP